ncbi:hypothetical protein [Flavobacterium sp.]|jgi:hypothetical protein|uniref:hypothetical protein n=1 Tax=Flavobacterium TaxID=237 RepID=UPI0022C81D55|nr:hypothetical protein [Flavobacterium sp.]MCZ8089276.1 hypothetical protein [Flavobacterium sp.]
MKTKALIIFLVIFAFVSCKKETEKKEQSVPEAVVDQDSDKNLFKVSFDLVVKKDDNMHLYYTEDGSINFDEKHSVWMPVKGNENTQEVIFKLPKDVLPTAIRVDFGYGKNESQSDVELKVFRMKYLDKVFEAKDTMIFNYFYPNKENTVVPFKTAILQRKSKDQPIGPILYPHEPLSVELQKMVQ